MFNRKVLSLALLAVVLVASFMDARGSLDQHHRRKPRAETAGSIAAVDSKFQTGLTNLMNQVAGIAAVDPDNLQATAVDQKPRKGGHKPRTAMNAADLDKLAGYAKALDPSGRIQG